MVKKGIKCADMNFTVIAEGISTSYQNEKDNEKCHPRLVLLCKITTGKEGNEAHQLIKQHL